MNQTKYYRITMVFDNDTNCQAVLPAKDATTALAQFLQSPSVSSYRELHSLKDFDVEELEELPIPSEDRFWLERRGDGMFVVIDVKRKRALSFEFGRLAETGRYTDFNGIKPQLSTVNTAFLLEADLWLRTYHPALIGME